MKNKGFTLIEIMVSLALFAVVALVAIGAFLKIIDANRRSEAIESAVNDTNFALDSMVRDLRVGSDYQCIVSAGINPPSSIASPSLTPCVSGAEIAFNSSVSGGTCNLIHAYEFYQPSPSSGIIEKAEQQTCGQAYGSGTYIFLPLTSSSSDLTISSFSVRVDPQSGLDTDQPKVFILLSGSAGASQEDQTSFTVQTTASQRLMQ